MMRRRALPRTKAHHPGLEALAGLCSCRLDRLKPPNQVAPHLIAIAFILLLSLAACQAAPARLQAPATLTVSAASDLTPAFGEIGREFTAETGQRVIFNFGSTGQLAQQISQGAPVDLFAAASLSYLDELERAGLIVPGTRQIYGRGYIVLWQRADSPLAVERIADLARPEVRRVAIANPDHAPYGVAARAALRSAGVWEAVQPKLVLGENVRQALQYAETGNVDVAIVALSLSVPAAAAVDVPGRVILVPEELYPPLDQGLAIIRDTPAEAAARAFAAWVVGPRGQAILRKYGFTRGPEPAP